MKFLFLHGWQSVPGGVKPTFLAQHSHEVVNPKLPDDDFAEAVRIAQAEFDRHQPLETNMGGQASRQILDFPGDIRGHSRRHYDRPAHSVDLAGLDRRVYGDLS